MDVKEKAYKYFIKQDFKYDGLYCLAWKSIDTWVD